MSVEAWPRPPSARVVDAACGAFALWTLASHATVAAGGSLALLVALFAGSLAAAIAVGWRTRGAATQPSSPPPPAPASDGPRQLALRAAGAAAVLLAVGVFHVRGGVVPLWLAGVAVLAVAAAVFVVARPPAAEPPEASRWHELGLWALALASVALVLACHRPDRDDTFYVNVAVHAADFPHAPLFPGDTLHGAAELPLMLPVYRLHSYELANGALAWLSGLPAIAVNHLLGAAIAALLLPLAHARVLRWLAPRDWLAATAAVAFVLLAVGETHRWYGNFAFVRMWQGKAVFLFVFLPLVYAYALELALRPSRGAWLRLAAAQIAALGCSSSALWAGPVAAWMALCCASRPDVAGLRRFAVGASASAYVVGVGLLARASMSSGGHGPSLKKDWTPGYQLEGALATVLGEDLLLAVALAVLFAGWACLRPGLGRRFAVVLPLASFAILLNPWLAREIVGNVTGGSYWRAMWSLPFPLLLGLVLVSPLQWARGPRSRAAALLGCAALAAVFAATVPRYSALSARNGGAGNEGLRLGRPGLKVNETMRGWAGALNDSVAPGAPVIAPFYVSVWVPTFHDGARPLEVRESYLRLYRRELGERDIQTRALVSRYVAGRSENPQAARIFERALERYGVQGVCLRRGPSTPEVTRILRRHGFEPRVRSLDHEVWARAAPPAGSES